MLKLRFCWLVMLMKLRYASTWWYSCAFTLAFDSSFVAIHYCPTGIKVIYISYCNGVCVQRHFFFKTNDAPEKVRYCTNYIRQSLSVIFLILKDFGNFIIKLCIILLINQLHMAGKLLLIDKLKPEVWRQKVTYFNQVESWLEVLSVKSNCKIHNRNKYQL